MRMRKTAISILFIFVLCFVMAACEKGSSEYGGVDLTLAVGKRQSADISKLAAAFNESQSNYKVKAEVYESDETVGYLLSHGAIDPDMVVFENINSVNLYSESLQPLNRFEATAKFQVSIINSLKAIEGDLFGLPSSGSIYLQCYNADLFSAKYIDEDDYPQALDGYNGKLGMLEIASRLDGYNANSENISYCNAMGDLSMVYMLMEVAVPMFASSTAGIDFIKKYYRNQDGIAIDLSEYRYNWESILRVYKSLFDCNYYSTDEQSEGNRNAINKFVSGQSYVYAGVPQAGLEKAYNDAGSPFKVAMYPFVGKTPNQKWIISKPDFYLSVAKEQTSTVNSPQSEGVKAFLSWFASAEGRKLSQSANESISYVGDMDIDISDDEPFKHLAKPISQNKIYLSDEFISTFSVTTNILKDYVNEKLTLNETITQIDKAVAAAAPDNEIVYTAQRDFDFPKSGVITSETAIGNMTADIIASQSSAEMAVLPSDIINCNVYGGKLSGRGLSVVFDGNETLVPVRIKIAGLKKILSDCADEGVFPLISGFRISGSDGDLKIVKTGGIALSDDDTALVLITKEWEQKCAVYIVKPSDGRYVSPFASVINYLDLHDCVFPQASADGRYGKYAL